MRLFLTGSVFGALLYQRGILPLHGSAIATPRGAVVFAGPSGSGKSTLAAEFRRRGYSILADELCAIRVGGCVELLPANPCLMLWADAIGALGLDRSVLRPARPELEKYIVPLGPAFSPEPIPLHAVYALESVNSCAAGPNPITGLKKIDLLAQNSYRPEFAEAMQLEAQSFANVAAVAPHVRMARIQRPRAGFRVAELADMIAGDFTA